MNNQTEFSNVTSMYLNRFHNILNKMVQEMIGVGLTNSISHDFILQMIPHHQAAIEMSCNILQYTTLIPLQNIASNIIKEQSKSIQNMERILSSCGMVQNTEQDLSLYLKRFDQITKTMFADMKNAYTTNNINTDFMREMIPHHKGAIQMSENALRFSICPELHPVFHAIIISQQKGLLEMEYLLKCMSSIC